jgi:hypothetical protein
MTTTSAGGRPRAGRRCRGSAGRRGSGQGGSPRDLPPGIVEEAARLRLVSRSITSQRFARPPRGRHLAMLGLVAFGEGRGDGAGVQRRDHRSRWVRPNSIPRHARSGSAPPSTRGRNASRRSGCRRSSPRRAGQHAGHRRWLSRAPRRRCSRQSRGRWERRTCARTTETVFQLSQHTRRQPVVARDIVTATRVATIARPRPRSPAFSGALVPFGRVKDADGDEHRLKRSPSLQLSRL